MIKGSLLIYKDLIEKITEDESYNKMFFDEIEARLGYPIKFIRNYLGDKQFIEFLDIVSGLRISFPSEKELKDMILGTQVKKYYDSLGGEEFNINYIAKKFGLGISKTRKLIEIYDYDYDRDKEKTFAEIDEECAEDEEQDESIVEEVTIIENPNKDDYEDEYYEDEWEDDNLNDYDEEDY